MKVHSIEEGEMQDIRGLVVIIFVVLIAPMLALTFSVYENFEECSNEQTQLALQRRPDPTQVQRSVQQCIAYGRALGGVIRESVK